MALIEREAAKAKVAETILGASELAEDMRQACYNAIDAVPAINAAPVVHGRWIRKAGKVMCGHCGGFADWTSSDGWWEQVERPYCGRCGARMDGGERHEAD